MLFSVLRHINVWWLGGLPKIWDEDRSSILGALQADAGQNGQLVKNPLLVLPDDKLVNDGSSARFVAGGMDGVTSHHVRPQDNKAAVDDIMSCLRRLLDDPGKSNAQAFHEAINRRDLLQVIDEVLRQIRSDPAIKQSKLNAVADWLLLNARDRQPLKFALALAQLKRDVPVLRDFIKLIASHEEFTLYGARALYANSPDPVGDVWDLARHLNGWGRIHAVRLLAGSGNEQVRGWILREGFRNSVSDGYLALDAARAGGLAKALEGHDVDDQLIDAACAILAELSSDDGPAGGLEDYEDWFEATGALLNHVSDRPCRLDRMRDVSLIRDRLAETAGYMMEDEEPGRSAVEELTGKADSYLQAGMSAGLIEEGLKSADDQTFNLAVSLARKRGMDIWEELLKRYGNDPYAGEWYHLLQTKDAKRLSRVIARAQALFDENPDVIRSGDGAVSGLVLRYFDMVVQELRHHPGKGWPLVKAALTSDILRDRAMAYQALAAWPRKRWPKEAKTAVREALEREPDDKLRKTHAPLV